MLTKEEFKRSICVLKSVMEHESALYKMGIELNERHPAFDFSAEYLRLLNKVMDQESISGAPTDLDYFIYDTEFGKRCDEYFITKSDGTEVKWHDEDEFWEYVNQENS